MGFEGGRKGCGGERKNIHPIFMQAKGTYTPAPGSPENGGCIQASKPVRILSVCESVCY